MKADEKSTCQERQVKRGIETEIAIDFVKTSFSRVFSQKLNLYKVSSPLAIEDSTGINDDLNGTEKAVSFRIKDIPNIRGVIVQSLAKWKRLRLMELELEVGEGIITDMKALRPDEHLSSVHSILVDQWDWEKVISKEQRNIDFLKKTVIDIYESLIFTEKLVCEKYPRIRSTLPDKITFLHAQDLFEMFPDLDPKKREDQAAKRYGAIFLVGIGAKLSNDQEHDGRAPDYDDWTTAGMNGLPGLNGDIIVWDPVSEKALELSSMGIRVDEESLIKQLNIRGCMERSSLYFQSSLLNGKLPLTIGGGIGQSRVCMFLLRKKHIGEVQAGIWPLQTRIACVEAGIGLI